MSGKLIILYVKICFACVFRQDGAKQEFIPRQRVGNFLKIQTACRLEGQQQGKGERNLTPFSSNNVPKQVFSPLCQTLQSWPGAANYKSGWHKSNVNSLFLLEGVTVSLDLCVRSPDILPMSWFNFDNCQVTERGFYFEKGGNSWFHGKSTHGWPSSKLFVLQPNFFAMLTMLSLSHTHRNTWETARRRST